MSSRLELVSPIIQDCPPPQLTGCWGRPLVTCDRGDYSCAYLNQGDPCEVSCVKNCPTGQKSIIYDDFIAEIKYRKCVPESEPTIGAFRCFTDDKGTNQFEIQGSW